MEHSHCEHKRLSAWWWAKVLINLTIIAQAVYLGVVDGSAWLDGLLLLVGQLLLFVGAAVNLVHFVLLKQAANDIKQPDVLLNDMGFFQFVRHPMYLGELMLVLGIVILCPNWLAVILYLGSVLSMTQLCRVEDDEMAQRFGAQYDAWAQRTKVLFPGLW